MFVVWRAEPRPRARAADDQAARPIRDARHAGAAKPPIIGIGVFIMKITLRFIVSSLALFAVLTLPAFSQLAVDVETGAVFSGYNDVRIPGKGGTLVSLSEDLSTDPAWFYRIRLLYDLSDRHHLGLLFAPLSLDAAGRLDRALVFQEAAFPADTPLDASYKFNSYRLTYRYDFHRSEALELGVGFTGKIRDARIAVEGNGIAAEKKNVGFVPIIHFRVLWRFSSPAAFLLEGDALAAPQGRAEDLLAALVVAVTERIDCRAGYRILEGGADNDEVYNFTLLHYASLGAQIRF